MKQENREEMERIVKNGQKVFGTILVIIVLMVLGVLLFSCSKDNRIDNTVNCNCGTVEVSNTFNLAVPGGIHQFSVMTVKNNCSGITKQIQRDGLYSVDDQICNY